MVTLGPLIRALPRFMNAASTTDPKAVGPGETARADAWDDSMGEKLEREILPKYLPTCRWFGRKGDLIRDVTVAHVLRLGDVPNARLLIAGAMPMPRDTTHTNVNARALASDRPAYARSRQIPLNIWRLRSKCPLRLPGRPCRVLMDS